jgi:hypothetical protein
MEQKLKDAAYYGREEEARKILKENKEINVNWGDESGYTALHGACNEAQDKVVTMLLAHPDIDVNQKSTYGSTPFLFACASGNTTCVQLMLKDARVKVNEPDNYGHPPLWFAAESGYLKLIQWWIASGREMDLGQPEKEYNDAIGGAKKYWKTEVISLLERFRDYPEETRYQVRVELGCLEEMAAEIFALAVFLCDGLLELKEENRAGAARFFRMAKKLPMELQMVLCHRVVGSAGGNIPGEQREVAFKELTRRIFL